MTVGIWSITVIPIIFPQKSSASSIQTSQYSVKNFAFSLCFIAFLTYSGSVSFFLVWPYTKNRFMSFFSGFFVRSTRLARLFDRSGSQAMFRFLAFALASHRPGKYLGFSLGFFWETLQLSGVVTSGRHKNYSEHHRFLAREIKHFNGRV